LFVKSDRACDDKTHTFVVTDYVNNHLALCDFMLLLICLTDVCTSCRPTFLHPSLLSLAHQVLSNHIILNHTQVTILDKTLNKLSSTHIIPGHTFQKNKTFLPPPSPRHEKMLNCPLVFSVPQTPTLSRQGWGRVNPRTSPAVTSKIFCERENSHLVLSRIAVKNRRKV